MQDLYLAFVRMLGRSEAANIEAARAHAAGDWQLALQHRRAASRRLKAASRLSNAVDRVCPGH
jgi:hypothetical protein